MKTSCSWTDELSEQDSIRVLEDLGTIHARQGGLHGWVIESMIKNHDYAGLCSYVLPQSDDGWDVLQLIHCRQALAFFAKYEPLPLDIDKEAAAYETYVASELLCSQTNAFFNAWERGLLNPLPKLAVHLFRARAKISRVLGKVPDVADLQLRFGPGSTTSIRKTEASWQRKLSEVPTCSEGLLRSYVFPSLCRALPHWLNEHQTGERIDEDGYVYATLQVACDCGTLQFVPKTAKTYRSIDVQPTLNTLLQGGIGRWMKERLRLVGVDITDQSMNQRLARVGSIDNTLCTIDLSSASDTVARALVRFLLPEEWYALLSAASCSTTKYCGDIRRLEKFSSMGNGFTFPLETLIFWALTASACEGNVEWVRAYGDDIICPRENAGAVVELLEQCGFKVNAKKSFLDGPFRESCGADYYKGINVRPFFYAQTRITAETLFLLHNGYVRNLQPELAALVKSWIAEPLLLYGPDGYGDGHLLSEEWSYIKPREARRRGFAGFYFETYRHIGCYTPSIYPGDYVTPLYSVYLRERECPEESKYYWAPDDERGPSLYNIGWRTPRGKDQIVTWAKSIDASETKFLDASCLRPMWSVPGSAGYEKARIYTLAR